MGYLDDVPFRTYGSFEDDSAKGTSLISPPDIEVPDCMEILMSTMVSLPVLRARVGVSPPYYSVGSVGWLVLVSCSGL